MCAQSNSYLLYRQASFHQATENAASKNASWSTNIEYYVLFNHVKEIKLKCFVLDDTPFW